MNTYTPPDRNTVTLDTETTVRFACTANGMLAQLVAAGLDAQRVTYDPFAPAFCTHQSVDVTFPVGTRNEYQIGGFFGPSRWFVPGIERALEYPYMDELKWTAALPDAP